MSRYDTDDDDWEEEYEDDIDSDDDEESLIACPHCGREILEDSQRCPHCEQYISAEDSPPSRKPWWVYVGVAVCLFLVYRWIVGRW